MFVNICVSTESGVEHPQGIKNDLRWVRMESVTHKMYDKEVTGYPAFLPQNAHPLNK